MRLLLNGFARFEYEIAYYLSIRELHRVSLLHLGARDDKSWGIIGLISIVRLDKMGNMHMLSRSVGIVAIMFFAWQSVGQAGAACQTVNGALCGGGGNGSISSVSGNVSLAQGAAILRASSGASISPGARMLAGNGGAAQVNLGAGCFASVESNSVATFTTQNGLICLRHNDPFTAADLPTHKAPPYEAPAPAGYDPGWVAGAVVLGGVGIVACVAFCDNQSSSISP
jgi:hypothetical protein